MTREGYGRLPGKVIAAAGLAAALLAPMRLAAYDYNDPRQLAMLPPYCKYTQSFRSSNVPGSNDPEQVKYWYSTFGGKNVGEGLFHDMHHYCEALMDVNFAKFYARNPQERLASLRNSLGQFDYVIEHSEPGAVLLPEFHTKKGESLIGMGNAPLAIKEFERAIGLKADYWPPYAAISDYYKSTGNIKLAREVLERGLAASPDARPLTRRLDELSTATDKCKTAAAPLKKPAAAPKQAAEEKAPAIPTAKNDYAATWWALIYPGSGQVRVNIALDLIRNLILAR